MRHVQSLPGTSSQSAGDMFEAMPRASTRPSASGTLRKSGTYASFLWRPELQLGRWRMGHFKCQEHELHVQRCRELQTGHRRVGRSSTHRLMTQSWMFGSGSSSKRRALPNYVGRQLLGRSWDHVHLGLLRCWHGWLFSLFGNLFAKSTRLVCKPHIGSFIFGAF